MLKVFSIKGNRINLDVVDFQMEMDHHCAKFIEANVYKLAWPH